MNVSDIIQFLGGSAGLAAGLGFPPADVGAKRIRAWAARSSIPAEYWLAIADYSKVSGKRVTLELLAAAHANRVSETV